MTRDALESLCLDLLRIDSQIGNEATIASFVTDFAKARGFHRVQREGDNVLLVPRAMRTDTRRVLLLGHLDTVPQSGENPARIDGDRIFGLGASDMKCADAVLLALLARAAIEAPAVDILGVLYAREEGPFRDSGLPEIMDAAPDAFENIDLAVAMEPTDNGIELGCLGTLHACARFRGTRAHSARPWQGKNAIHAAAPLLNALRKLPAREVLQHGHRFVEVCSATMIAYEGARNVIPGSCSVNVNFRYGPDRTPEEAVAWIEAWIRDHAAVNDSNDLEIELLDVCPSGRVCGDNALMLQLRSSRSPPIPTSAKQAWTDVGRLSDMGMDAINYGPGAGAQAHQVGEWCSREAIPRNSRHPLSLALALNKRSSRKRRLRLTL